MDNECFTYHPEIMKAFPTIQAGLVFGEAANQPTADELKTRYFAEQQSVLEAIGDAPLSEMESLAAWRRAFRQMGVNPTRYRSAIEALLRRLTKKGDIPSINTLVDIGNLISIRYRIPVAVFDLDRTADSILVRFAAGDEPFTPLFTEEVETPEPGEVIFMDGNGLVAARRWCWRQSDQSAARIDTRRVMVVTEAHHAAGGEAVRAAAADLAALCGEFLGGMWMNRSSGE